MKTRTLFDPLIAFIIPSAFSVLLWRFTPAQWFDDLRISSKVDGLYVYVSWALSYLAFAFGSIVRRGTFVPKPARPALAVAEAHRVQWLTFGMCTLSMVILCVLVLSDAGPAGLLDTDAVRNSYVGGITTFTLLTNAGIALAGIYLITERASTRIAMLPLFGMIAFAVYRGFIGAERIALYVPCLAVGLPYILMKFPRLSSKAILLTLAGFVGIVGIFVVGEYFRTFTVKQALGENITSNWLEYGWQRFVLYFSTSVNSGGAEFSFFATNVSQAPLFSNTLSPLAKVLYSTFGMEPVVLGNGTSFSADLAVSMGLFNPEFNNQWGVATPFTEGWIPGMLFWVTWGYWGTHLYLNVTRRLGDAWDWTFFGLFMVAFIDNQSRVALLAAPHFLVPFLWLYMVRWLSRVFAVPAIDPKFCLWGRLEQSQKTRHTLPHSNDGESSFREGH
jgi:hypothetical protein